ncbi:HDOD domain-containing protein [Aquitalea pelogenes]|uniref:HDOD domain-containing protein n=1 Tax=Aquitalea pelogenes TaxID=1293573 RepID=UPI0009EA5C87|nr:HDOD domain-containing protein [Aquitalea pelogenes]
MTPLISTDERDELLKNLVIPPRPDVLDKLMGLRQDPDITLQKLDDIINEDPALCVAMLKAANTPILGRGRHITSVHQAISLLGIKNVISLVSGLVLRTRLTAETPPALEQFWDGTLQIAMISSALCDRIVHVTDDCRSFALFHNCGMAIMLMRFPSYRRTLRLVEMASDDRVGLVEQELHGTRHDVVGYLVARSWNMPENFAKAILMQNDDTVMDTSPDAPLDHDGRMMVAVTRAARHVWRTLTPGKEDAGWEARKDEVLNYLGMSDVEFEDWVDAMHQELAVTA